MNEEIKRGPGRPRREEETKQRRRRREGLDATRNLKLFISKESKDPNFEYRWVTDRPGRVQYLTTQDDWDVVTTSGMADPGPNVSEGTTMQRISNQVHGDKAVLVRKPKEYYEEDYNKSQKALDRADESLRHKPPSDPDGLNGPESYIPGGRNTINGR